MGMEVLVQDQSVLYWVCGMVKNDNDDKILDWTKHEPCETDIKEDKNRAPQ